MKVIMVNSSPHEHGCTYTALCEVQKALTAEGVDSEILWIGTDPDDPSKRIPMTEFSKLLQPDTVSEQTYYLFVHMKETAGNEFNRKEQAIYSGIGITVYAVQGNFDVSTEE